MSIKMILAAVLALSAGTQAQQEDVQRGIVAFSAVYMNREPDYESPLETQELMGTEVEVLGRKGYWLEIHCPQPYRAWTTDKGIVLMSGEQLEEYRKAPKCIFTGQTGKVMLSPDSSAETICDLVYGDIMRIAPVAGGCARKGTHGAFTAVQLPDGRLGYVDAGSVEPLDAWKERCASLTPAQKRAGVLAFARSLCGVPYLWGGMTTRGADCSGLTRLSFLSVGESLPRNASQQALLGTEIPVPMGPDGIFDTSSLVEGDLIFFGKVREDGSRRVTHVGIYAGDGRMIHSSHLVRINSMHADRPDCYENIGRLLFAKRILGQQ